MDSKKGLNIITALRENYDDFKRISKVLEKYQDVPELNELRIKSLNAIDALGKVSLDIDPKWLVKNYKPDFEPYLVKFDMSRFFIDDNNQTISGLQFVKAVKDKFQIGLKEAKDLYDSIKENDYVFGAYDLTSNGDIINTQINKHLRKDYNIETVFELFEINSGELRLITVKKVYDGIYK